MEIISLVIHAGGRVEEVTRVRARQLQLVTTVDAWCTRFKLNGTSWFSVHVLEVFIGPLGMQHKSLEEITEGKIHFVLFFFKKPAIPQDTCPVRNLNKTRGFVPGLQHVITINLPLIVKYSSDSQAPENSNTEALHIQRGVSLFCNFDSVSLLLYRRSSTQVLMP